MTHLSPGKEVKPYPSKIRPQTPKQTSYLLRINLKQKKKKKKKKRKKKVK